ncbi:MAG: MBL fold metallo-hydrolase [Alphaproteobacteria bacterium]|nr:MBL fold metallo-hydrolase [Alphaproteobacteria bacterium]
MQWRIGDVLIKRVVEIEIPTPYDAERPFIPEATPAALRAMPWLYPNFVTEDDALKLSVHALLVDAPGLKLVVDTCFGNDKPRYLIGRQPLATAFLSEIAAAGFPRESVTTVACTHLHVDHVGWNTMLEDGAWKPTFPNARYLMGHDEYAHWSTHSETREQKAVMADSVQPIFDAGLVDLVETNHRLSPEIRFMPTVGHTPGHVSVVIESKGEKAVITGDLMHHPAQITQPDWGPPFDSDSAQARETRRRFVNEFADAPVLVIGTHFATPTAGYVKRIDGALRFIA